MSSPSTPSPYRHNRVHPPTRPQCPVCNRSLFSRSEMHPQCAVVHQERLLAAARKAAAAAEAGGA